MYAWVSLMGNAQGHFMGRVRRIHFVGIGGAGMSGIAEVLHNLGYQVSGTDLNEGSSVKRLKALGIDVKLGHAASNIEGSDIVVFSSAVSPSNPELTRADELRIPVVRRAQMLADLMRFHSGIAVAGTHGKTTTTSLIASILAEGGLDPTYVIGGLLNSAGSHARLGSGKYLVAEADESDASFHHLHPAIAVLTNIDRDHLENYDNDFQNLKENFSEFMSRLPFYGVGVICADNEASAEIAKNNYGSFITYGIDHAADFAGYKLNQQGARMHFSVKHNDDPDWLDVQLNLPGKHNVLNALAAIAVANELGVSKPDICRALSGFQGIGRRCEILGELDLDNKTVLLIDDYAHHPAEIAAVLTAVRNGWPGRRVVVVFQPHRYTRTSDLYEQFCSILADVDVLILMEIYSAGEEPIMGISGQSLADGISQKGKVKPVFIDDLGKVTDTLIELTQDQDILLILGAGSIGTLGKKLQAEFGVKVH